MSFKPIKSDTPTNTLFAAMEHAENASGVLVIIARDKDETHETHMLFANEAMTVAQAAWLLESAKLNLHMAAKED